MIRGLPVTVSARIREPRFHRSDVAVPITGRPSLYSKDEIRQLDRRHDDEVATPAATTDLLLYVRPARRERHAGGEAINLQPQDVDWIKGVLTMVRQIWEVSADSAPPVHAGSAAQVCDATRRALRSASGILFFVTSRGTSWTSRTSAESSRALAPDWPPSTGVRYGPRLHDFRIIPSAGLFRVAGSNLEKS
jgi:hypothetical protein